MQCRNAAILSPLASSSAFAVEFASGPVVWRVAASGHSQACFALPKHLGFRVLASKNGRPPLYPTILWSLLQVPPSKEPESLETLNLRCHMDITYIPGIPSLSLGRHAVMSRIRFGSDFRFRMKQSGQYC